MRRNANSSVHISFIRCLAHNDFQLIRCRLRINDKVIEGFSLSIIQYDIVWSGDKLRWPDLPRICPGSDVTQNEKSSGFPHPPLAVDQSRYRSRSKNENSLPSQVLAG